MLLGLDRLGVIQCQTYIPTSVILKVLVRSHGPRSGTTSCTPRSAILKVLVRSRGSRSGTTSFTPRSAILTALVRSRGLGLGNLLLCSRVSYALKSRPAQRMF
jgi:hypothetical protein